MGSVAQFGGMGLSAGGAYKKAEIDKMTGRTNAWVDRNNAQIAEYQASQALQNGATEEQSSRLRTADVYGRERAALGANGVDLGQGSATDVLASTKLLGERDALAIHDNALRTAWGYDVEATNFKNKAALDDAGANTINPWMSGLSSMLGSASSSGFSMPSMSAPSSGGSFTSSGGGAAGFAGVFVGSGG